MPDKQPIDPTAVWVFGKVEKKWHCAKAVWDQGFADDLIAQGYKVDRSVKSPAIKEGF